MRLEKAVRAFRKLLEGYAHFEALANQLAMTPFSEKQLGHVINVVLPLPEDEEKHPRLVKARAKVVDTFPGRPSAPR
ncbi:hypothetical protein POL68_13555 [Stigmatella sp. ncwal1]|uniref:Uncharacterized protein n=1 Tax=Stigmatella ashevillensis TaxID=2995309 RepID=A0ABT5D7F6_9BACT|nr:hypothetical protein [Stigmatella ashevillena]MDC0709491.1 hypothetical protein [Stigmatella ashevillena]